MKVLYLTYDGLTDPLGQSQILPYIFGLSKKGYQFTIVSFEKKENQQGAPAISKELKERSIEWIPLSYTKNPPVLSTLIDIYRLQKNAFKLHRKERFRIVHCRSYITSLAGMEMKVKFRIKFIFDMRGFWADERVDGNLWNLKNPLFRIIYQYFKKKEQVFLHSSDYVISLTQSGEQVIRKKLAPESTVPIQVIPCCVDTQHFDPGKSTNLEKIRSKLGISNDVFVLGYVGSIGTWYMLSEMINFFSVFLKEKPESIFLFVTKENPEIIKKECDKGKVSMDQIRIVSASRQEVPSYISLMDWSIFFIKPLFSKQASSPTKQGEIMSMGIPIICNKGIGDTDRIVERYESGITIQSFTKADYEMAIKGIDQFPYSKQKLRERSKEYFGLEKGIRLYEEVYAACLSESTY